MACLAFHHSSSTQHQLTFQTNSQYSASAVGLRATHAPAAHHVHSMHLLQIQLQTQHRSTNRTTLFSNTTIDLSNFSSPVNSNTITKDLPTSSHPARISTQNSIPSSRTAQLSDIPPTDLTESLSSTDSLTECTDSSSTHTPHPTNQTDTGPPTNSSSFIRPFRIVTINFQSCRNKTCVGKEVYAMLVPMALV